MRAVSLVVVLVLSGCRETDGVKDTQDTEVIQGDTEDPSGTEDADGDGYIDDCDDNNPDVFPGNTEYCDGLDNDCDSEVDEDAVDATTWYADTDGDGYGDLSAATDACEMPAGYSANGDDCDDTNAQFNPGSIESDCEDPNDYNCDGSVGYTDADGDGYAACTECDDADAAVNPDAEEVCNGIDDDCNVLVDGDDPNVTGGSTWYADADGDGFGGSQFVVEDCEAPAGYVSNSDDCDDLDADSYPSAIEVCDDADNDCDGSVDEGVGATWYADGDGDGYGDSSSSVESCDPVAGYSANGNDCDDTAAATSPAAYEFCDGIDNNCDGSVDESSSMDASDWYADSDSDGYGDASAWVSACEAPSGHVADDTDCDDSSALVSPGVTETCDGLDNDCDSEVDEDAVDATTWYADTDSDGYGNAASSQHACAVPGGYVADATDCDDTNTAVNPGTTETCNGTDDNCDGDTDEGVEATWYADFDSDSYGNANLSQVACSAPAAYVADSGDCNDVDGAINPGATEVCDVSDTDEDCSGAADDADASVTGTTDYYPDTDSDGFGDASATAAPWCDPPSGVVTDNTDCDDAETTTNPSATDTWYDGVDSNCDSANDYDQDVDGDEALAHGGTDRNDTDSSCTTTCPDGLTQATAGITCATLLAALPSATDGTYWLDFDGAGGTQDAFQGYCDMGAGGWTYQSSGTPFQIDFTGSLFTLTVPSVDTEYEFSLYGASDGGGPNSPPQQGGLAKGNKVFSASSSIHVYVGGQGAAGGSADSGSCDTRTGGWNGGGRGSRGGSGGGGATDIRTLAGDLSTRILVAGGAGGCGYGGGGCDYQGGDGGGLSGDNGNDSWTSCGQGGTQTAGGTNAHTSSANGSFGVGADNVQCNDEGGGGGGWYGGASGGVDNCTGGGGSSYFDGMDSNQSTTSGANTGSGYAQYILK